MKKSFLLFFTCISLNVFGQSAMVDAISLTKLDLPAQGGVKIEIDITGENLGVIKKIMLNYGLSDIDYTNDSELGEAIDDLFPVDNPFLNFNYSTGESVNALSSETSTQKNIDKSSIGASKDSPFSLGLIADGAAKFLVKRAKQELSVAFFEKFKKAINNNKELSLLFPQTKEVFNVIDNEIYNFSNYLNSLKQAFENDLANVLENMSIYVDDVFRADDNIKEPALSALFVIDRLKKSVHPGDVINDLVKKQEISRYQSDGFKEVMYSIQVLDVFSQSLRSGTTSYWGTDQEFESLTSIITFKIYLGLLYAKHKDIVIGDDTFGNVLDRNKKNILILKNGLEQMISSLKYLTADISRMNNNTLEPYESTSSINFFAHYFDLLESIDQLYNVFDVKATDLEKFVRVGRKTSDIYRNAREKQFHSLVMNIIVLSQELGFESDVFKSNVLKYGTFVANVAQAEDSDEVMAAIEAVALPVGSSRVKRVSKFNVSLNAYVGPYYGRETLSGAEMNPEASVTGLTSPIGVAASWGLKPEWSISLFASFIDIGALTAYRFDNQNPEGVPDFELQNIIAPGGFLILGIKGTPISIGGGYQFGPSLRKITVTIPPDDPMGTPSLGTELSGAKGWRAFIAVDIPLLNFYTSSK